MSSFKDNRFIRDILPILLLVLGIAANIFAYRNGKLVSLIEQVLPRNAFEERASEILEQTGKDPGDYSYDIRRNESRIYGDIETDFTENIGEATNFQAIGREATDGDLIKYVQVYDLPDSTAVDFPFYIHDVLCRGAAVDNADSLQLAFSPSGRLLYFAESKRPALPADSSISGPDNNALDKIAREFMTSIAKIDTGIYSLEGMNAWGTSGKMYSRLTYKQKTNRLPDAVETVTIGISSRNVTAFLLHTSVEFSNEVVRENRGGLTIVYSEASNIVLGVISAICWFFTIIISLVIFIQKMRRDEMGTRGLWYGVIMFAVMFLMIMADSDGILEILLGGTLAGLFMGALLAFAFNTGESLTREVWSDKLQSIDSLVQGRIHVKEIGEALVKSLGLAGISLILLSAGKYGLDITGGTWIEINENFYQDSSLRFYAEIVTEWFYAVVIIFPIMILILSSYIRKMIKRTPLAVILFTFAAVFMGHAQGGMKPDLISIAAVVPATAFLSWRLFKDEFLTIFLAAALVFILIPLHHLLLLDPSRIALPAILLYTFISMIYIAGIYLTWTGRSMDSIEKYVPDYITRLAERERIQRELEIARNFQQQLLPFQTPEYESASIGAMCVPASEVGGDYFDYFPHEDNRLGLIIGDVSGKGVPAAFAMTMVKGIIKTLAETIDSPCESLCHLNKVFTANTVKGVFVSTIYAVFDFSKMELCFSRAGHVPLLVWNSRNRTFKHLTPSGIAVGLESGELFDKLIIEQTIKCEPGDIFLFYTDGISEASNTRGEEFGEERIESIIRRYADEPPQVILDQIYNAVQRLAGKAGYHDDITAVLVKIH